MRHQQHGPPELAGLAPIGLSIKANQLAKMEDGVYTTDVPHVYRVHSKSGKISGFSAWLAEVPASSDGMQNW